MNTAEAMLKGLIKTAERPRGELDYCEDGLIYCGNCRTPRQTRIEMLGRLYTMPVACRCMAERLTAERDLEENRERERRIERLKIQGIQDEAMRSDSFANDDGGNPTQTFRAKQYCSNWNEMHRDNIGLLFWGGVGTGKTFLAACIANALMEKGVPVMMTNFARIINAMTDFKAFDREGINKNEYIDSLNHFKLLVIDDLGAERQSDFALETVYNVIDARCRNKRPLIITTNLTLDEIKNPKEIKFGRIYDRVLEVCVPMRFDGESRRRQSLKNNIQKARLMFGD